MIQPRFLLYLLCLALAAFGATMALPVFVGWWFSEYPSVLPFLGTGSVLALGSALLASLLKPRHMPALSRKSGMLLTVLVWVSFAVLGAIPLMLSAGTGYLNGLFEATSGLTTTGATVLSGLDEAPKALLFWRAWLQWLGGMGMVLLVVSLLPSLGVGGATLFQSEVAGVEKQKLFPRLRQTAAWLWGLYASLTVACAAAYGVAGMGFFDAICHAMTTVSTAGFSTRDASLAAFENAHIEFVAVLFMFLGAVNFVLLHRVLSQRSTKPLRQSMEVQTFAVLLMVAIFIVTLTLLSFQEHPLETARRAIFNTVSVFTTTGYTTSGFEHWPTAALALLVPLAILGGCSGSTTGGVKLLRPMVMVKHSQRHMLQLLHPKRILPLRVNGVAVGLGQLHAVWAYLGLFIGSFIVFFALFAALGLNTITAFGTTWAMLTNLGPGLGDVGSAAGYAHLSDSAKVLCLLAMLLGRLEFFTVMILFLPGFWKR